MVSQFPLTIQMSDGVGLALQQTSSEVHCPLNGQTLFGAQHSWQVPSGHLLGHGSIHSGPFGYAGFGISGEMQHELAQ